MNSKILIYFPLLLFCFCCNLQAQEEWIQMSYNKSLLHGQRDILTGNVAVGTNAENAGVYGYQITCQGRNVQDGSLTIDANGSGLIVVDIVPPHHADQYSVLVEIFDVVTLEIIDSQSHMWSHAAHGGGG